MMIGTVQALHALMTITFLLPDGSHRDVEFVIDTGFTGFLTVPAQVIASLGIPFIHKERAYLADDSAIEIPVHRGVIFWQGSVIEVDVMAMGRRPLLGTALLADHELLSQFAENGLVTVDTL